VGKRQGFYNFEFGLVSYAVTLIVFLSTFVLWSIRSLEEADRQRRRIEEELRQHQAEFAHALRLNTMGEMVAGIAHQLNQPLSAIANFAHGCVRRMQDGCDEKSELIEVGNAIVHESLRATEIIRSLMRYVKKREPQRSMVNINLVAQGAARLVAGQANQNGVRIMLSCSPGLPKVKGDHVQLEQVLVNLLCNGIDASKGVSREKFVAIETRSSVGRVKVLVIDNGCGLPASAGASIFEAFLLQNPRDWGWAWQ